MPEFRTNTAFRQDSGDNQLSTLTEYFESFSGSGATVGTRFRRDIVVQISGTGTITAQVQRSTQDPAINPNWAPAEDSGFSGDVSLLSPRVYSEPYIAWWRVLISSLTGGTANISIMGIPV